MYEMQVSGEMIAVRLPDGSSGRFTGGIEGIYQGYRLVGPPEQRGTMELEHGTLALVLRHEVPARPTGEREGNPFDDGKDPFAGLELVSVARPEGSDEEGGPPPFMQGGGGPPPWMQGGGGPPPWMQGEGGPPPWMQGEGGPPPWAQGGGPGGGPPPWMQGGGGPPGQLTGQGDPSQWGAGRSVVAHSIKLEIDGSQSTGIYAGASGEMTVEAPNHKTAGYMVITSSQGTLRLEFLEWYEKGELVADLWVDGAKSTGIYQNARGDLKFALGFYAAFEPNGPLKDMCAKGHYSGTLRLEREPVTA